MDTTPRSARSHLLERLGALQPTEGSLSAAGLTEVSRDLGLTTNDAFGVASFYPELGVADMPGWRGDPEYGAGLPADLAVPERAGLPAMFTGLEAALRMSPAQILVRLRTAGVARRTGGREPLADALERLAATAATPRCLVCDAAEHDPAAAGVTWLAAAAPGAIVEGLAIAGRAAAAAHAVVFVAGGSAAHAGRLAGAVGDLDAWRASQPEAAVGDLGEGADATLHVDVIEGLPALVLSEETALLAALEGRRPMPAPQWRPARELTLWGMPCTVVDAETLARLPELFAPDVATGARAGDMTADPVRGVRLFTVSGCVARAGVVEVAADAGLDEIVAAAGGVAVGGAKAAVQVGGPAGVWLPESLLGLAVDDPVVRGAGSRLSSGSLVVAEAGTCAVELAWRSLAVLERESCGRCVVCREGLMQMTEVLTDILKGRGRADDIDLLHRLAQTLATTGPCEWGRAAANPVLSTLQHFGADYQAHLKGDACPAGSARPAGALGAGSGA